VNTCRAQGKGGARVGRRATASVVGRSRGLAWCQTSTAFIQGALRDSLNWVLSEGLLRSVCYLKGCYGSVCYLKGCYGSVCYLKGCYGLAAWRQKQPPAVCVI
jgi:hypothetical protein